MAPSMCPDPCGTRWGSWFQAFLYHISAAYLVFMRSTYFLMPHNADMVNKAYSHARHGTSGRSAAGDHTHTQSVNIRRAARRFTSITPVDNASASHLHLHSIRPCSAPSVTGHLPPAHFPSSRLTFVHST